ncbi:N/A [soil metagenome]
MKILSSNTSTHLLTTVGIGAVAALLGLFALLDLYILSPLLDINVHDLPFVPYEATLVFTLIALCITILLSLIIYLWQSVSRSNTALSTEARQRNKAESELKKSETEQKLLEYAQILDLRNQQLQQSNQELQDFAYVASHDLQEPLRMIGSYTQLLQKRYQGKLDQDADDFINYAVQGVERMKTLINDLLAYSRVETSNKKFTLVNMQETLEWSLANLTAAIAESNVILTQDSLPNVYGDKTQLGELWQNLLANAMRYKDKQRPLQIHIGVSEKNNNYVFSVADNGIGIAPEYHEKIFILFQRLHTNVEHKGTGMGLALCKKIIARHHGEIWVRSKINEGSTFYFSIPKINKQEAML